MCDEGRNTYKFVNKEARLLKSYQYANGAWGTELSAGAAAKNLSKVLKNAKTEELALVLTGQHTVEEYTAIVEMFTAQLKSKNIFHWNNNESTANDFDGLLIRGDKNPNTKGLVQVLSQHGVSAKWSELESQLSSGKIKQLIVVGPENIAAYTDIESKLNLFAKADHLIYLTSASLPQWEKCTSLKTVTVVPLKTYIEKDGTFVNHAGLAQKFKKVTTVVSEALTVTEAAQLMSGAEIKIETVDSKNLFVSTNQRPDQVVIEHRKKNEFVFNRGRL